MIRINIKNRTARKATKRLKNKARIRKKVDGTTERPRLAVVRSGKHVYAPIIDDSTGSTLVACDQLDRSARLIELDPKYVDAIVGRWCKYKDDPTVVKNGKSIQWTV